MRGSLRRILTCLLACAAAALAAAAPARPADASAPRRIVSLAPSVTECLFALGLGPRVVGVTDWCAWPPAARELPRIGGHVDPSLEAVLARAPDLVILEEVHAEARAGLAALDVPLLTVEHRTVAGILASLDRIGAACGADSAAAALRGAIEARMDAVRRRAAGRSRPRVLVVVGRTLADGSVGDVYAAGGGTFLGELVELAGGENVCAIEAVRYPQLSLEGVLRLAPDLILDLAPEFDGRPAAVQALREAWADLGGFAATSEGRAHVLTEDWLLVPGPRFVDVLERFAVLIHPEGTEP